MDRRGFFQKLIKLAVSGASIHLGQVSGLFSWGFSGGGTESCCYLKQPDKSTRCLVCPHGCTLKNGDFGLCRTRTNINGIQRNTAYQNPCIVDVVPIEMSPLYHFLPSTNAFSLTTGGCNLKCLYCQNWTISQLKPSQTRNLDVPAGKAVELTLSKNCRSIVFSYGEPVCYLEYADEIGELARKEGLKVNWVTAGYINKEPLQRVNRFVDAYTVTLKAFNDKVYRDLTGVNLKPVLNTLNDIVVSGKWLEIVNLVVPTYNDDIRDIRKMCRWIKKNLGPDVPLHFGRFHPKYKLSKLPSTPIRNMEEARQSAFEEGMKHVYLSNVSPHDGNNTYCSGCGTALIKRLGFSVIEMKLKEGVCPKCSRKLPGIF